MTLTRMNPLHQFVRKIARAVAAANGRARERTITLEDTLRVIGRAARRREPRTTGRQAVPNSYGYPAHYTAADAVPHPTDPFGSVSWSIDRVSCSRATPLRVSTGHPVYIAEHAVDWWIASRIAHSLDFPGADYGIRRIDGGYDMHRIIDAPYPSRVLGRTFQLPHWDQQGHYYYEHVAPDEGLREARRERERKIRAHRARNRLPDTTLRHVLWAIGPVGRRTLATVADSLAAGNCADGTVAWLAEKGLPADAQIPLAVLIREKDERARNVALHVARKTQKP